MKLSKTFRCVPPGEIYPVDLAAGDECPKEYEHSAREQGCLGKIDHASAAAAKKVAPDKADADKADAEKAK